MKVYFSKVKDSEPNGLFWSAEALTFQATRPLVIQPLEIMRVPINVVLRIPEGAVLSINTHEKLTDKVGVLFPPVLTLNHSSSTAPLELAIKNEGRNPLHIMPGQAVGIGYLFSLENIEREEFSIEIESKERPKSQPLKRNKDVKFEVK